jgi:hypothetical protein
MKERYNSEKNLKKSFDNFQMPFDNDAFDKFKTDLDKEENNRKFIWWIFYGKIVAPILFISLLVIIIIYIPVINDNPKLTSANTITTNNKQNLSTESILETEQAEPELENSTPSQVEEMPNMKILADVNNGKTSLTYEGATSNWVATNKRLIKEYIIPQFSNQNTSSLRPINNNSIVPYSSDGLIKHNKSSSSDVSEVFDESNGLKKFIESNELEISERGPNQSVAEVQFIESLNKSHTTSENHIQVQYDGLIKPYVEKFRKHIYFNLALGVTKEDNFGVSDPFFNISKTNEILWSTSLAYQFNPNTSVELSFMRKNISLGYSLENFDYWEKVGSKVNIFKLGLVNKILSFNPKSKLNLTNGVSIIYASQTFNEGADFGKTVSSQNIPDNISNINFDWQGLYSSNHFVFSSGLILDYQLSRNVEMTFGAEYNLGFKPIMRANLNYIEGEGILKNVETHSKGSFASFNVGLKYRLRRN